MEYSAGFYLSVHTLMNLETDHAKDDLLST
jgi:hypothetical protein